MWSSGRKQSQVEVGGALLASWTDIGSSCSELSHQSLLINARFFFKPAQTHFHACYCCLHANYQLQPRRTGQATVLFKLHDTA